MSEREDTKFLVDWVREWVGKMHRDISDKERGRIADEMCCEWAGSGIGASYQEYMIEYNPGLANVLLPAGDNAGLVERLRPNGDPLNASEALRLEAADALSAAQAEIARLANALENLLTNHARLVESGDCGNWDVDQEPEVIEARAALDSLSGQTGESV